MHLSGMSFRICGNNENIKWQTQMALVCLIFGWKVKTMFGNKQHHAQNMDVKTIVFKFVFYTYCAVYSVYTILKY